ncbi:MAG: hypothetical protein ACI89J_002519 [Hyphomicrobiaceae bacterium]|jgi:hypothetical protein
MSGRKMQLTRHRNTPSGSRSCWQVSRLADIRAHLWRPPAFPALKPVALETSPVTVTGVAALQANGPIAFPFHLR